MGKDKYAVTLLNCSILTAYGEYRYVPINLAQARQAVGDLGFKSAIGHESTAQIISELLGIDCSVNRIIYEQKTGESALVFKLKRRSPEGKILTREEIEDIGYEWGILCKIK